MCSALHTRLLTKFFLDPRTPPPPTLPSLFIKAIIVMLLTDYCVTQHNEVTQKLGKSRKSRTTSTCQQRWKLLLCMFMIGQSETSQS